jgi:hypothetical protein
MKSETRNSIWRRTQGLLWRGLACLVVLCGLGYLSKASITPLGWLVFGTIFLAGLETILTLGKLCLRPRDLRYWLGLLGLASFFVFVVFVCCSFKGHETVDYAVIPPGMNPPATFQHGREVVTVPVILVTLAVVLATFAIVGIVRQVRRRKSAAPGQMT